LEVGNYNVKVVTTDSLYTSESNYVICFQPEPPIIIIPNVLTPNGDGLNDIFVIRNLLVYDYRKIVIFNRWGKAVYTSEGYNNDWDGKGVSDGVYFVVVTILNNGVLEEHTGNITILGN
jgi:gliding motility-associated-like protein